MEKRNRDIQDFVYFMIHSKSLTRGQQAKRDTLLAKDLIRPQMDTSTSKTIEEDWVQPDNRICEFHEPQKVYEFLHKFTINNTALKYTTHFWDKNFETGEYKYKKLGDFKSDYMKEIDGFDYRTFKPKHLGLIVKNFLDPDENINYSWSEHKLKIGYNSFVGEWMVANPGLQPASMPIYEFPKYLQPNGLVSGKVLSYFSDVIDIFKHCIEYRDNDLYISFRRIFKSADHIIDKEALNTIRGRSIYTDTELVNEALRIIAGNIFQRPMFPKLKISCNSASRGDNKIIQLRILQVGSFSNRDINDEKLKGKSEEGVFYSIKEKLRNLCDFSVESNFRIGNEIRHCRINYLSSVGTTEDYEFIDNQECEGFTYILTFYTD